MLCVIIHIRKYTSDNSDDDHRKQVNNVIKTSLYGLSEDEFHVTIYLFWGEYTELDHNNCPFDGDEFIWKTKDISDSYSHLWH